MARSTASDADARPGPGVTRAPPLVAILMGTCNGARFIDEQLASLARQTHSHWRLIVSDDGSQDDTVARVQAFAARCAPGQVQIRPGRGFVHNFLQLACDPAIEADYFAFSYQDDVWDPDRLACSLQALQGLDPAVPALYGARTRGTDSAGRTLGESPLFARPPSFRNALVQSMAGGNTMTFNRAARELLRRAGPVALPVHYWWLYIVVSACGGRVIYDPRPHLGYRQHAANLIGRGLAWSDRWRRNRAVLAGRLRVWNQAFEQALGRLDAHLDNDSRRVFAAFARARRAGPLGALIELRRSGVYRQTRWGQLALWAAASGGYL